MSVRLRFDFWHLQATKGNTSELLSEVLEICSKLAEDHEDRLPPRDTKVVRLHKLEKRGALWFGDFLGIGVRRPAKKANTKGLVEDLPFSDDEGLGEESAFLIDRFCERPHRVLGGRRSGSRDRSGAGPWRR